MNIDTDNSVRRDAAQGEIRLLVVSDIGTMHDERTLLADAVFPEVRRRCSARGIACTDIDLQRRSGARTVRSERLLRSTIEEIRRNSPLVIALLGTEGGVVEATLRQGLLAEPSMRERSWLYARRGNERGEADAVPSRALADAIRRSALRLRDGWSNPAELVDLVRGDLLPAIDDILLPVGDHLDDRERRAHEAFAASRRMGTVQRPQLAALLDVMTGIDGESVSGSALSIAANAAGHAAPVMIAGPSGAGKSTLVAQWCAGLRRRRPGAFVITHHVGAATSMESGRDVARRIIREICLRLRVVDDAGARDVLDDLPLWLARAGAVGLVLVIDGLDQLAEGPDLNWLPAYIPPGVLLVGTSTVLPDTARVRGWRTLEVRPLARNERLAFGAHYSGPAGISGVKEHLPGLADDAVLSTPLALRVRMEELRLTGSRTERAGTAAHLAAAPDVVDLMVRLIECWEREFGDRAVREMLTAIRCTRRGLLQNQLAAMVSCSEVDLADMLTTMDLHLVRTDGRIRFQHDAFRRGVEQRYPLSDAEAGDLHLALADLFTAAATADAEELPWHLMQAGRGDLLRDCICRTDVLHTFVELERSWELVQYWRETGDGEAMAAAYERALAGMDAHPPGERAQAMHDVAVILRQVGRYDAARELLERAALLLEATGEEHVELHGTIASRLAGLLLTAGDLNAAEHWSRVGLEALRRQHEGSHQRVARALAGLAGVLAAAGRYAEAEEGYREALAMMEGSDAPEEQIAGLLNDLAAMLHDAGRLEESEALYRRALDVWRAAFGDDHPSTAIAVNNLAALLFDRGDFEGALALRRRVVELWERALGPEHPMVATALANLAGQLAFTDPAAALPLLQRARAIHESVLLKPTHETAVIVHAMGRVYYLLEDLEAAERELRYALALQREMLGAEHLDTAVTLGSLATVLRDRGDLLLAEQLLHTSIAAMQRHLGDSHPRVGMATINLAGVARRRGDTERARELARQGVRVLGNLDLLGPAQAAELREFLAGEEG